MHRTKSPSAQIIGLMTLTLALPGVALAYGERDAINDCESHIRSEYQITDLRDATAERLNDVALHFKVQGLAKVDGDKHPWTCEVKNRHVTSAEYSGPKPKGMSTAGKLAIGAAAVAAGAIAINEASKHGSTSQAGSGAGASQSASGGSGASDLQDLIGARAPGGDSEMESRGYNLVANDKWSNGWHCVTVRTHQAHYASIVDTPMKHCH